MSAARRRAWSSGRYDAPAGLSRQPEAEVDRAPRSGSASRSAADEMAIEERPRRRAVHHDDRRPLALVDVAHAAAVHVEQCGARTGTRARSTHAGITRIARPLGLPERLHDLGQRRAHREHATHAQLLQRLDVARRDGAADDHRDIAGVLGPQPVEHAPRQRQMGAGEHREPDDVHVLLDRLLDDLLGRPLEPGVDRPRARRRAARGPRPSPRGRVRRARAWR